MRTDVYEVLANEARVHWWFQAREGILLEFIERRRTELFPTGRAGRILDIGAGAGQLAEAMLSFGEVTALEGAPEALDVLGGIGGIRVVSGFLPNDAIESDHFDLVTAFDVLEHIEDDHLAARNAYEVVRPGGHFLATVPAHPFLWSDHDVIHHHFRRYRPAESVALLESVGFEVRFASPFQCYLFPLLLVERMVRRVLRRGPEASARLGVPPRPINGLLRGVFASEGRRLAGGRSLPFGSSQMVYGRKPL